eukprot:GEMP01085998.1.p1 GENE.GEMP01085998.1~~GEMP01085998.1.p1  ORF type:complete len:148 (+),score=19.04 GEMP01085998.1:115-558(+)
MLCLALFTVTVALEPFGQINEENALEYMDSGKDTIWFSFHPDSVAADAEKYRAMITEVAIEQSDRHFVYIDSSDHSDHASESFGCQEFPCITLMKYVKLDEADAEHEEKIYSKSFDVSRDLTKQDLESFIDDAYAGNIQPFKHRDDL